MSAGSITALVETLVGAGATPEMILAAVRTAEAQKDAALEQSRAKARARVQKWRDKKDETSRNVTQRSVAATKRLTRGEDNLQTKNTSGEEKKVVSPSARPSRGSRIPEDFQPDIDAAVSEGVPRPEAERQARSFCDYWRAKPGKDGLKLDWPATWRVWYRRNIPPAPKPQATAPPSRQPRTVAELALHRLETGQTRYEPPDQPDRRLGESHGSGQAQGPGVLELVAIAANGYGRNQ